MEEIKEEQKAEDAMSGEEDKPEGVSEEVEYPEEYNGNLGIHHI